jgi:chemotaxis signal transduction protein
VAVLGVVSVRGRILTLLDPLALLDEQRAIAHTQRAPAFILALRGDEQLALAVDSAESLREINADEIRPPATFAEAKLAHGIFQDEEASVVILDVAQLFAAAVEGMEYRRRRRVLEDES